MPEVQRSKSLQTGRGTLRRVEAARSAPRIVSRFWCDVLPLRGGDADVLAEPRDLDPKRHLIDCCPRRRFARPWHDDERASTRSGHRNMTLLRRFGRPWAIAILAALAAALPALADTVNTRERQVRELAPGVYTIRHADPPTTSPTATRRL
jgi:hypothetical protein